MSFSSQLQLLSTTWSLIKSSSRIFAGHAYKRKPDKIFLSCAYPPCNNLYIPFLIFLCHFSLFLSLLFFFVFSFFAFSPSPSVFLPQYCRTLFFSLSPSCRSGILTRFFQLPGTALAGWLNYRSSVL